MNKNEKQVVHHMGIVVSATIAIVVLFSVCYLYGYIKSFNMSFNSIPLSFSDILSTAMKIAPTLIVVCITYILLALFIIKFTHSNLFKSMESPENKPPAKKAFILPICFALLLITSAFCGTINEDLLFSIRTLWWLFWLSIAWILFWDSYIIYLFGSLTLNTLLAILIGVGYMFLDGYSDGLKIKESPTKNCTIIYINNERYTFKILSYFNTGVLLKNDTYQFVPFDQISKIDIPKEPIYCDSYIPSIKNVRFLGLLFQLTKPA